MKNLVKVKLEQSKVEQPVVPALDGIRDFVESGMGSPSWVASASLARTAAGANEVMTWARSTPAAVVGS